MAMNFNDRVEMFSPCARRDPLVCRGILKKYYFASELLNRRSLFWNPAAAGAAPSGKLPFEAFLQLCSWTIS